MSLLLLLAGLAGLWYGTEVTIRSASAIASRLGMSEFIVGVAILSVGSDLPELAIAIDGAVRTAAGSDASSVIVGSAIGSTLGQIGFVLGASGLIAALTLSRQIVFRHGSVLLGSIVVLTWTAIDGQVSRIEGGLLLAAYAVYFLLLWTDVRSSGTSHDADGQGVPRAAFMLVVGLVIVFVAAETTVRSALELAASLGVSEAVIALLLVGLGTSLPELSISIGAVLRGKSKMSVGNLIGSNIFDTLVPIGAASAIATVNFDAGILRFELPYLFGISVLVLLFFLRRQGIRRLQAGILLLLYAIYAAYRLLGPSTGS